MRKIVFVLTIIIFLSSLVFLRIAENTQAQIVESEIQTSGNNYPTRIVIPKINVDLPVKEAEIIDGYWEVHDDYVSWGAESGFVGVPGNQVLFAHNKIGFFARLPELVNGDIVYVYSNDEMFKYIILNTKTVKPSDKSVIEASDDEILTLYTCDGPLDSLRFVASGIRAL